jgi:hypothetical protein
MRYGRGNPPVMAPEHPCALHPEKQATFACVRCGTFSCEECRSAAQAGLCRSCELRLSEAKAKRVGLVETLRASVAMPVTLWRESLVYLAVACLVGLPFRLLVYKLLGAHLRSDAELSGRLQEWIRTPGHELSRLAPWSVSYLNRLAVRTLAGFPGWAGALLANGALDVSAFAAAQGRPCTVAHSYRVASRRWGWLLLNSGLALLGIFLGTLLCCVPGVVWCVCMLFVDPLVVLANIRNPFIAFRESTRLAARAKGAATALVLLTTAFVVTLDRLVRALPGPLDGGWRTWAQQFLDVFPSRLVGPPLILGVLFLYLRLTNHGGVDAQDAPSNLQP